MKDPISKALIILGVSAISFFWMLNETYQISMDAFMAPLLEPFQNTNFIFKILIVIIVLIIYLIVAIISGLFAFVWPFGIFRAFILLLHGSYDGAAGKAKLTSSSSSSSSGSGNKHSGNSLHYTNSNAKTNNDSRKPIIPGNRTEVFNHETGKFEKKSGFFYQETDNSVDMETGKYQNSFLGVKSDTGKKIDFESGEIFKDSFLGYEKTGTRVDQNTGRIQKNDFLGWSDTNERIDPETGKRQKEDFLGGWRDVD